MSRVLNIVYSLLEAGPDDDFDPKDALLSTEPSGAHWLLAQGFKQEGDSYRKTYKNGWAVVRITAVDATPFEVVLNFRDGGRQSYFSLNFEELKYRLRQYRVIAESGPDDDLDPKDYIKKLPEREPRIAYAILPSDLLDPTKTHISPIIVKEGEPGYSQTNWAWRREYAEQALDDQNAKLGLTPTEAEQVLMSSMFSKKKRRLKEEGPDDVNPREMLNQLPEPILAELSVDITNDDSTMVIDTRKATVDANEFLKARSPDKLAMYYRISSGSQHKTFGLTFMGDSPAAVQIFRQFSNTEPLIDYLLNREGTAHMTFNSKALRRWIEKNRPEVLTEAGPDDVDPREYLRALPERDPRIKISFSRTTPESSAEGDTSENGWIDEEGEQMWPDAYDREDGISVVDKAAKFLRDEGATQASASHFQPGVWYSTGYQPIDYATGEDEEKNYHLHGFTADEEQEIWNKLREGFPRGWHQA